MYNFDKIINRENTNCVKYDLNKEIFGTEDLLSMWVADMDFETPDFILNAIQKRTEHPILGYTYRSESFFQSIINWTNRRHNWKLEKAWIGFTPGVVPAVHMAITAFSHPGDKIIVQPPVYFPFFNAVELNGRRLVYNHLKLENGRYNFDFENLKSQIDSSVKMLILSNPHNPGGSVWTKEELTELASICIENNILIVSDEIHGDLVFKEFKFTHLASISKEISEICISLIAPSKTFNLAGLASSVTIISNEKLRLRFNEVLEQWHVGMGNLFGIVALESAFNNGDQWLDELLEYVNDNINYFSDYIRNHIPEITLIKPEGTYLIWIDFSKLGMSDKDLNEFIIKEAKLGLNKGTMFGPGGEGYMRMNVACPKETLNKALEQLNAAIEKRFR